MAFMYGLTPETLAQLSPYLRKRNNGQADLLPIDYGQATQPPPSGGIAFEPQVVAGMPLAPEESVMFGPSIGMPVPMPPISAQPIALEPSAIATRQMPSMVAETPAINLASVLPPPQEYVAPEPVAPAPAKFTSPAKPKAEQMPEPAGVAPLLAGNLAIAPYLSSLAQAASEEEKKAVEKYQGEMTEGGGARIMMKQVSPRSGEELEFEAIYQPALGEQPAKVTFKNPFLRNPIPTTITADTQDEAQRDLFRRVEEQYKLIQAEKAPTTTLADSEQRQVKLLDSENYRDYRKYLIGDSPGTIKIETGLGYSEIPVTQVPDYEKDPELLSIYQQGQAASPFGRLRGITGEPGGTFTIPAPEGGQPQELATLRDIVAKRYLGERPVGTYRSQIKPVVTYVDPASGATFSSPADPNATSSNLMPSFSFDYGPDVPEHVREKMDRRAAETNELVLSEFEAVVQGQTAVEKPADMARMETIERQLKALGDERKRLEGIIANNQSTPDQKKAATEELKTVDDGIAAKRRERISVLTASTGLTTTGIGGGRTAVTQGVGPGLTKISNVSPTWNTVSANLTAPPEGTMEPQQGMATVGEVVAPEKFAEAIRDNVLGEVDQEQTGKGSRQVQITQKWSEFFDYLDDTAEKIRADAEEVYGLNAAAVLDMPINKDKRLTLNSLYQDIADISSMYNAALQDGVVTAGEASRMTEAANKILASVQGGMRIAGTAEKVDGKTEKFNEYYDGPGIKDLAETPFAVVEPFTASNLPLMQLRVKRFTDFIKQDQAASTVTPPPPPGKTPIPKYKYRPAWGRLKQIQTPIYRSSILNAVASQSPDPAVRGQIMNEVLYSPDGYEQAVESSFATHQRPSDHTQALALAKDNVNAYNKWIWEKNDPDAKAARREYLMAYFYLLDEEGMGYFRAGSPGNIAGNLSAKTFADDAESLLQGKMTKAQFRAKYKIPDAPFVSSNESYLDNWFKSQYAQKIKSTGISVLKWDENPSKNKSSWRKNNSKWTIADHNTESIGLQIIAGLVDLTDALDLAKDPNNVQPDGTVKLTRANAEPVSWLTSPGDNRRMFLSIPAAWQAGRVGKIELLKPAQGETNETGDDSTVVSTTDITAANSLMKKIVAVNILRGFTDILVNKGPASVKQNHAKIMRGVNNNIGGQRTMTVEASQDQNVEYVPGQTEIEGADAFLTQTIPQMMLRFFDGASIWNRRIR